ncbi:MAG TPA: 23S rRNA (uracil(1939)-C(5))-methyltransferase RlmD, partial [Firmicutes bacterium]|nr:23S rRNA (uracil(1939)-C(5))-methyltransferase RlmD [Bacillota bacterium]
GVVPGDRIQATITEVHKNYVRARLERLLEGSPDRVDPMCIDFGQCGGCQLLQWSYQAQLTWKERRVHEVLTRIGGLTSLPVRPIIPSPLIWHYRNKAQFKVAAAGGGSNTESICTVKIGFYSSGSHNLVPLGERCRLMHPLINQAVQFLKTHLPKYSIPCSGNGGLQQIICRVSFARKQLLLTLAGGKRLAEQQTAAQVTKLAHEMKVDIPGLAGLTLSISMPSGNRKQGPEPENITVWGQNFIEEDLPAAHGRSITFRISASSFFQVNPTQAANLFNTVMALAQPGPDLFALDAYCGTGSIALYLAQAGGMVWGIEEVEEAVADAIVNAELNDLGNVHFSAGKVEKTAGKIVTRYGPPDILVVDPPRSGCSEQFLTAALSWQPRRWVYVSCNLATLARDLRFLSSAGYRPTVVQPVDMFPHTSHVECVVLMSRVDK